jgi:predicted dithiol-disulfide oxidoreductase (DUF899 family)
MAIPEHLPTVVSRDEWLAARKELLAKEKEATRARDRLNTERRQLPMVPVAKDYEFEGPGGKVHLGDLFDGREQLIVHHAMWAPPDAEPCTGCAGHIDSIPRLRQLHARNTSLVVVSRAPYAKLAAFGERMGWSFPWYSSDGSDFNDDFLALLDLRATPNAKEPEIPGLNVFLRVGDQIFHTYSTTARGVEYLGSEAPYLDITALGRQEPWEKPEGRAKELGLEAGGPGLVQPDKLKLGASS